MILAQYCDLLSVSECGNPYSGQLVRLICYGIPYGCESAKTALHGVKVGANHLGTADELTRVSDDARDRVWLPFYQEHLLPVARQGRKMAVVPWPLIEKQSRNTASEIRFSVTL